MEERERYVLVERDFLENPNLSMKAKGLFALILSFPKGSMIRKSELHQHFSDGTHAVRSAIKELEDHGYLLKQQQTRDSIGRFH